MNAFPDVRSRAGASGIALDGDVARVLRNTYALLAMTLLASAGTAALAMATSAPPLPWWMTLAGFFGLLLLVGAVRNSVWALPAVFALTGFMGFTLGPMLSAYLALPGGPALVTQAFAGTAAVFLALSGYVLTTRRDFSFLGGFVTAGMVVLLLAAVGALLFELPTLSLVVSAGAVLLMSALILYETSQIVNGGERNYVMATVALYVSIYNLFTSLLHLLGVFGSEE